MLVLRNTQASVLFTKECLEKMKAGKSDFSAFFDEVCLCCNAALVTDKDRQHVKQICEALKEFTNENQT